MPVIRNRLANHRQVSTVSLMWPPNSGERYHVTVGECENGAPGEVWVHGTKVGSELDAMLDDAKSKMAPPAGAKWFERHGEALRRSDGNLEQIGILRPWLPPDFRLDITEKQRIEILRYVNECWMRERPLAQQAKGRKFAEVVPAKFEFITKQHARFLLDEWFREGIVANEKMSGKANIRGLRVVKDDLLRTLF